MLTSLIAIVSYFALQKQGFHIDEIYSYGLSNSYYHPFPIKTNSWLTGDYYADYLMPNAQTRFAWGSAITNQIKDVHPPVFYLLLHGLSSIWPAGFSPMVGLSLNIIIHLFTVAALSLLSYKLSHNYYISLFVGWLWGVSIGGLSSMLFIRMYHLLGFGMVSLLIAMLYFVDASKKRLWLSAVFTYLIVLAGALTHYYFYLYAFFVIAITCLRLLLTAKYRRLIVLGLVSLTSVFTAWGLFPAIFTHLTSSNRGMEVMTNANDGSFTENIMTYLGFISHDLLAGIPPWLAGVILSSLAILLFVIYRQYLRRDRLLMIAQIVLPVVLYILLVQDLSHYHTARYIYPIYGIIIVCIAMPIYFSICSFTRLSTLTMLAAISFSGYALTTGVVSFQYHDQGEINQSIRQSPSESALIFSEKRWQIAQYAVQLSQYKEVYPMVLTATDPDSLPDMEQTSSLTVYVNNLHLNQEALLASLKEKYHFNQSRTLYSDKKVIVYYLSQ